ncbi:MAG: DnaD domain protein [Dehalococcoidia bacterium]|nr:DnaD domain protein [Dehalococcoidia bacterium]
MTPEAAPAFEGFVAGGAATTLPAQFFVDLLPAIEDTEELRATLYALYAIARKRGPLRAVRASELAAEAPLARAFAHRGGAEAVRAALDAAVARGTFVACPLADGDALYFMNNDAGRRALMRVRAGALEAPALAARLPAPAARPPRPAEVYEQEIGVLSPAVADAIAEAVGRWPEQWLVEAIRLAALRNARSWNYVRAVLERWEAEGRDTDATTGTAATRTQAGRDHGPYEKVIRRS